MEFDLVMDLARVVLGVELIRGWLVIEMFGGLLILIVHPAGLSVDGVESVVGVADLLLYPVGGTLVVDLGILIASVMVPLPISLFHVLDERNGRKDIQSERILVLSDRR